MGKTNIEWADFSWNPWIGCTKVSPGCENCYAESEDKRRGWTPDGWGKGKERKRTSEAYWKQPLRWNREAEQSAPARLANYLRPDGGKRRPRVFCASLADWLDDEVPIEWLADLLALIHATPNLDWLLLSKRPENWYRRLMSASAVWARHSLPETEHVFLWTDDWMKGRTPNNVWIGTSVEDQKRADERIPKLLAIPAKVRFLSCEPLLGPVRLDQYHIPTTSGYLCGDALTGWKATSMYSAITDGPKVHWVIIGGESGPDSRPCNIEWVRSIVRQCKAAGVPAFVKQLGTRPVEDIFDQRGGPLGFQRVDGIHRKGGDPAEWPEDLRIREFP